MLGYHFHSHGPLKGISARHEECGVVSGEPFLDLLEKSFQAVLEWSCCLDGEYPNKMGSRGAHPDEIHGQHPLLVISSTF